MSHSMTDDYFAFMSNKSTSKLSTPGTVTVAKSEKIAMRFDTVDFLVSSEIEVTESVASDTMIQRIFKPAG